MAVSFPLHSSTQRTLAGQETLKRKRPNETENKKLKTELFSKGGKEGDILKWVRFIQGVCRPLLLR